MVTSSEKYKSTVRVCLLMILNDFIAKHDMNDVDKLVVWSDGPSCEFWNQYVTGKLLFELSQVVDAWPGGNALLPSMAKVCVCVMVWAGP